MCLYLKYSSEDIRITQRFTRNPKRSEQRVTTAKRTATADKRTLLGITHASSSGYQSKKNRNTGERTDLSFKLPTCNPVVGVATAKRTATPEKNA